MTQFARNLGIPPEDAGAFYFGLKCGLGILLLITRKTELHYHKYTLLIKHFSHSNLLERRGLFLLQGAPG